MRASESENNVNKNFLFAYNPSNYANALIVILEFFRVNKIKLI